MKIIFLGDIVGRPGRKAVKELLPSVIDEYSPDLVVVNGENAAGGFGLTTEVAEELFRLGIDVITLGNHTWKNKEIYQVFNRYSQVLRPANYPPGTPGEGYGLFVAKNGYQVGIINLLGQVYLEPPLDCPFKVAEESVNFLKRKTPYVLIDIHAEATSEKVALANYLDGVASAVLGTHTHVATADQRILPKGTGYITDMGMCGPLDSVLGVKKELAIQKFITKRPVRFEIASGITEINGVYLELDQKGSAKVINRINYRRK
ncbi:MAG TPA: TIGR00282 family metallophosphoesterase [Firmicutes bacterium]|nr:TIGR00282 family metallophosphoesterase [Bacillota bacterium]HBT18151.1 TIGR00282 family metallophosphoesterase [Bacillota bacterium]